MTVRDVQETLGARFASGEEWADREVHMACGSDMMSDVLAFVKDRAVLLTGLCNPQVIRTAEMMDIPCVIIVRGKEPTPLMLEIAADRGITVMNTKLRMYSVCGILYNHGLPADEGE